jgi:pimeloyl-ACP methyl ester carboxylesterase
VAQTAAEKRALLWSLLGRLPDRNVPVRGQVLTERRTEHYLLQELLLELNGFEPVPAWFATPTSGTGPFPAVLYHHAHAGDYAHGKTELIEGRRELRQPPYAEELTRQGYAVLAIDHWNFGARHKRTESSLFKEMLWCGQVLWGMMIFDAVRALDCLASHPAVDPTRIATMGMSMGSTLSWWVAALDERVKVCIDLCCLTDFDELILENGLDRHGLYYYVPDLLNHFSTSTINELISPRPHFSLAGTMDDLTPAAGLDRVDAHLRQVYGAAGAHDAWLLKRYGCAHEEIPEMRRDILAWLDAWL